MIVLTKGTEKRWKLEINFFFFYLTLSNAPLRFRKRGHAVKSTNRLFGIKMALIHERGQLCELCGAESDQLQLHHIKPLKDFPALWDDVDNLQLVCHKCHVKLHKDYEL